jgi:hypothetical protein
MSFLADLLATQLPGDADWPSGALVEAEVAGDLPDDVLADLARVMPGFAAGDEVALRQAETAQPAAFERAVAAAYLAYYTAPAVRQVLARLTGYEDRPPQPLGYDLPPFDLALLDRQRARAPFWRDPDAP